MLLGPGAAGAWSWEGTVETSATKVASNGEKCLKIWTKRCGGELPGGETHQKRPNTGSKE